MHRLSDIDLKLLRVFAAIVESGGIAHAQVALNLSQSTISTQLAELEKRLGFRLCRRGRAGFALTPAGERLYAASGDLFGAVDRFQKVTADVSGEMKGVLKIGTVDAMLSNPDGVRACIHRAGIGGDIDIAETEIGKSAVIHP
jgi:DNA-binding transcriptional LysR family regulator